MPDAKAYPEPSLDGYTDAAVITTSDVSDLSRACRAFYVAVAADEFRVTTAAGNIVNTGPLAVGIFPLHVRKIHAAGTTQATVLVLY